jgi:hypothetical protein
MQSSGAASLPVCDAEPFHMNSAQADLLDHGQRELGETSCTTLTLNVNPTAWVNASPGTAWSQAPPHAITSCSFIRIKICRGRCRERRGYHTGADTHPLERHPPAPGG